MPEPDFADLVANFSATAGHMVRVLKRGGGASLQWDGQSYSWPEDNTVTEVPYGLALALLAVPDGDFRVEGDPEPLAAVVAPVDYAQTAETAGLGGSEEGAESGGLEDELVTGPEPATGPAPEDEGEAAVPTPPNQASPVTAKPRAATAKRAGAAGRTRTGTASRSTARGARSGK